MTILLPHRKAAISSLIIAILFIGCGNDNKSTTTQNETVEPTPVQSSNLPEQNSYAYKYVEKTFNGQTVYILEIDDFPLKDELFEVIEKDANSGDPAAQYELGRKIIGVGPRQHIINTDNILIFAPENRAILTF